MSQINHWSSYWCLIMMIKIWFNSYMWWINDKGTIIATAVFNDSCQCDDWQIYKLKYWYAHRCLQLFLRPFLFCLLEVKWGLCIRFHKDGHLIETETSRTRIFISLMKTICLHISASVRTHVVMNLPKVLFIWPLLSRLQLLQHRKEGG